MRSQLPYLAITCFCAAAAVQAVDGGAHDQADPNAADLVKALPGFGSLGATKLYSGQLQPDSHRNIQYALVEKEGSSNLSSEPLILFLNGGPGCSGIGGAFLAEVGPFFATWDKGGKPALRPNPHSWSKLASLLFLDVPVGVGWSWSTQEEDYQLDDAKTARDNYNIIQTFLKKFPAFQSSPLHIFGESYAGHFATQLVDLIVTKNDELASGLGQNADLGEKSDVIIRIEGLGLVNAWVDPWHDEMGIVDYMYHHGLVSTKAAKELGKLCDFGPDGDDDRSEERLNAISACDNALFDAVLEQGWLDIYYISEDQCDSPFLKDHHRAALNATTISPAAKLLATRKILADRAGSSSSSGTIHSSLMGPGVARAAAHVAAGAHPARVAPAHVQASAGNVGAVADYDPCIAIQRVDYMNLREVQDALHGNMSGDILGPWCPCCNVIQYHNDDILVSVLPIYRRLVALPKDKAVRILAMSGDQDSVVPFTSTRGWVESLDLPLLKDWSPWYSSSDQVAGFSAVYEGLTFATVRSAGHMVPYAQPERTFWLLSRFLENKDP